jgi:hypothetical protein
LGVAQAAFAALVSVSVCSLSSLRGVGHDPVALSAVRRTDGASWNTEHPHFVALSFHRSENSGEAHVSDPRRILEKRPSGPDFGQASDSRRPEPAVICRSSLLACARGRLAGHASGEEPDIASLNGIDRFVPFSLVLLNGSLPTLVPVSMLASGVGHAAVFTSPPISNSPFLSALRLFLPAFDASGVGHAPMEGPDIVVDWHSGPASGKELTASSVDFHKLDCLYPIPICRQCKAAYARKQVKVRPQTAALFLHACTAMVAFRVIRSNRWRQVSRNGSRVA